MSTLTVAKISQIDFIKFDQLLYFASHPAGFGKAEESTQTKKLLYTNKIL